MKYIIDTDKLPCNNGMNCTTCPFWPIDAICEIKEQVKNLPKYEERPHGEWITKKDSLQTFCSHCDKAIPYSDEYDFSDFVICPYCGARMRKEGDEK